MKITSIEVIINLTLFSALAVVGSELEAIEGRDVTISFDIDGVERAGEVRITFTCKAGNERVIARLPSRYDKPPPSGVSLKVGIGRVFVTIQRVDSSRSGVYKALALFGASFGEKVSEVNATLVVNKAPVSSTIAPPHSSTPNPLNSDLLWLCALIPLVILGGVCFWIYRRVLCFGNREPAGNVDDLCKENGEALLQDI